MHSSYGRSWFAWRPVRIHDGSWVFFKKVWRVTHVNHNLERTERYYRLNKGN